MKSARRCQSRTLLATLLLAVLLFWSATDAYTVKSPHRITKPASAASRWEEPDYDEGKNKIPQDRARDPLPADSAEVEAAARIREDPVAEALAQQRRRRLARATKTDRISIWDILPQDFDASPQQRVIQEHVERMEALCRTAAQGTFGGDWGPCVQAARELYEGHGSGPLHAQHERGASYLERACDAGEPTACRFHARSLQADVRRDLRFLQARRAQRAEDPSRPSFVERLATSRNDTVDPASFRGRESVHASEQLSTRALQRQLMQSFQRWGRGCELNDLESCSRLQQICAESSRPAPLREGACEALRLARRVFRPESARHWKRILQDSAFQH